MGNSASASRVDTRSNPLGSVSLGAQERAVLAVLLSNVGRVVSRRELSRQAGLAELSERRCDSILVGGAVWGPTPSAPSVLADGGSTNRRLRRRKHCCEV